MCHVIATYCILFSTCRALNEQVALSSVHPSQLASDVLVIPLCVDVRRDSNNGDYFLGLLQDCGQRAGQN